MDKVKIVFMLGDDGWGEIYSESLWADRCQDGFILDNIPIYKKGVCYDDIVIGKKISDGFFEYTKTVKKSKNSVYRVIFEKKNNAQLLLKQIEALGCIYETNDLGSHILVAISIPETADMDDVWALIKTGIDNQTWEAQTGDDRHPYKK